MSEIAATEARAVGAYARADALAAPAALRRADPVRPRFDIVDAPATKRPADRQPAPSPRDAAPGDGGRVSAGVTAARQDSGFLAQAVAQAGEDDHPPASAFRHAAAAYGRDGAAGRPRPDVEVLSPFPRLASGRTLDLSV
ncbi:MAG: hypothetical protein AB1918_03560 [Pseudomonadota bacterium]